MIDNNIGYQNKKVLITGASGFVASYLIPALKKRGAVVYGIGRKTIAIQELSKYVTINLQNAEEVSAFIDETKPDFCFHLASQSSVGTSWEQEWDTIETNVKITYNILKAIEMSGCHTRFLLVSSGEVYGNLNEKEAVETDFLKPINPYATSKAMMEILAQRFHSDTIYCVIARAFNHTGKGRPANFFESSMAQQFARAYESGQKNVALRVGNIEVVRDYSDVREVVEKYIYLALNGKSGDIYNVCSGKGIVLRDIIKIFEKITGLSATIDMDTSLFRKKEIKYLVGQNSLKELFLTTAYPIEDALKLLFESYMK